MAEYRKNIPIVAPEFRISNKSDITRTKRVGTIVEEMAVATFDPSANTAQRPIAAYGLGVFIPTNAIIVDAWIDVVTTCASAGADAGTIALSLESANDIVAAIAISDASNVWDAGRRGTKIGSYATSGNAETALVQAASRAGSYVKTTAIRELTATVAAQALTAGKFNVYVKYIISD